MAYRIKVSHEVDLPMSCQDIADYLELTVETVSPTLAGLEHSAAGLLSSRPVFLEAVAGERSAPHKQA